VVGVVAGAATAPAVGDQSTAPTGATGGTLDSLVQSLLGR
jgi:hypothetical protein